MPATTRVQFHLILLSSLCSNPRVMNRDNKYRVHLALGGNLGQPEQAFVSACQALSAHPQIELCKAASLYRTPAVGGPCGQPDYLNTVIELATDLEAEELLQLCLQIETSAGRQRDVRWAARTLDIDLLLIGKLQINSASLTLPHPLMHKRHFVLLPLVEIAAELQHPQLGCSMSSLLKSLPPAEGIVRLKDKWIEHD